MFISFHISMSCWNGLKYSCYMHAVKQNTPYQNWRKFSKNVHNSNHPYKKIATKVQQLFILEFSFSTNKANKTNNFVKLNSYLESVTWYKKQEMF